MEFDQIINDSVVITASAGGVVALALYIRKIFGGLGLENARVAGENDVIRILRDEVNRLADTNTKMAVALRDLQEEVTRLRKENSDLSTEIETLSNEIKSLARKQAEKCEVCPHRCD